MHTSHPPTHGNANQFTIGPQLHQPIINPSHSFQQPQLHLLHLQTQQQSTQYLPPGSSGLQQSRYSNMPLFQNQPQASVPTSGPTVSPLHSKSSSVSSGVVSLPTNYPGTLAGSVPGRPAGMFGLTRTASTTSSTISALSTIITPVSSILTNTVGDGSVSVGNSVGSMPGGHRHSTGIGFPCQASKSSGTIGLATHASFSSPATDTRPIPGVTPSSSTISSSSSPSSASLARRLSHSEIFEVDASTAGISSSSVALPTSALATSCWTTDSNPAAARRSAGSMASSTSSSASSTPFRARLAIVRCAYLGDPPPPKTLQPSQSTLSEATDQAAETDDQQQNNTEKDREELASSDSERAIPTSFGDGSVASMSDVSRDTFCTRPLCLKLGEFVELLRVDSETSWCLGRSGESEGWFPMDHVEACTNTEYRLSKSIRHISYSATERLWTGETSLADSNSSSPPADLNQAEVVTSTDTNLAPPLDQAATSASTPTADVMSTLPLFDRFLNNYSRSDQETESLVSPTQEHIITTPTPKPVSPTASASSPLTSRNLHSLSGQSVFPTPAPPPPPPLPPPSLMLGQACWMPTTAPLGTTTISVAPTSPVGQLSHNDPSIWPSSGLKYSTSLNTTGSVVQHAVRMPPSATSISAASSFCMQSRSLSPLSSQQLLSGSRNDSNLRTSESLSYSHCVNDYAW
ncbi:unnamed protein product [Protopolystoma xenopodis]|uniref:SH3 domain-containing protein n=1 Tax=Protopolystoma xenopodis TaxID=117903 RepID=A0A448WA68_9PLAT|nr:unnamed protein product [Protopolystoma xenopodis]